MILETPIPLGRQITPSKIYPSLDRVDYLAINGDIDTLEEAFIRDNAQLEAMMVAEIDRQIDSNHTLRYIFGASLFRFYLARWVRHADICITVFGPQAARELGVQFANSEVVRQGLIKLGVILTSVQLQNLAQSVSKKAQNSPLVNGVLTAASIALLKGVARSQIGNGLKRTSRVVVATSLNNTREQVFIDNSAVIERMVYNAILDGRTCPICHRLNGMVLNFHDWLRTQWMAPIHDYCRCFWEAVKGTDTNKPRFTGPRIVPGFVQPPFTTFVERNGGSR